MHPTFTRKKNVAFSKDDFLDTRAQACRRMLIENKFDRVKMIWKRTHGPIAISKLKYVHREWPIVFPSARFTRSTKEDFASHTRL